MSDNMTGLAMYYVEAVCNGVQNANGQWLHKVTLEDSQSIYNRGSRLYGGDWHTAVNEQLSKEAV